MNHPQDIKPVEAATPRPLTIPVQGESVNGTKVEIHVNLPTLKFQVLRVGTTFHAIVHLTSECAEQGDSPVAFAHNTLGQLKATITTTVAAKTLGISLPELFIAGSPLM